MSDRVQPHQTDADAAEGERVCAELKHQLDGARVLVQEARMVLGAQALNEARSFAPRDRD